MVARRGQRCNRGPLLRFARLRLLNPRPLRILPAVAALLATAGAAATPAAMRPSPFFPLVVARASEFFTPIVQPVSPQVPNGERDVVETSRLRYEEVDGNGGSRQVVQRLFHIGTSAGAQFFAVDDIWYDASRFDFHLLEARIVRAGRDAGHGRDMGDFSPPASGNRSRHVDFRGLRAGDDVDVVYALTPKPISDGLAFERHYLGDLFAFRGPYYVQSVRYVLRSQHLLAVSQEGVPAPAFSAGEGGYTWQWQAANLKPFFADDEGPSITDSSPFVQVSDFQTWNDLARWYAGWLAQQARLTPQFRAELLRLVPPAATPEQTVVQVWNYLSHHLGYYGREVGLHAYLPSPVEAVWKAQEGDCKDGSLLLSTWLRAEGVDAYVALVRTRHMGRVADGAATLAAFDHAVVYVPATNQWIDTTAPTFRPSEVPSSDQGGLALIVRPDQQSLVQIPEAPAAANFTRRVVRIIPRMNGGSIAEGTVTVQGADAPSTRARYTRNTPAEALQEWVNNTFPGGKVLYASVSGLAPGKDEVTIRFRVQLPHHPFEWTAAWTHRGYTPVLASEASRTQEKELDLRWTTDETWMMPADDEQCDEARDSVGFDRTSAFGELSIHATCSHNWLTVRTLVRQTAARVPAAEYPEFRNFWLSADRSLNTPVFDLPGVTARAENPAGDARPAAQPEAASKAVGAPQ
jgi:hypothetical protein